MTYVIFLIATSEGLGGFGKPACQSLTKLYQLTEGARSFIISDGTDGVVLFQRTVVLLSFYALSLLIIKVSHRDDPGRDAIRT